MICYFRYYVGAGLLLYGFDKGIRMINSSRQHTMESIIFDKDSSVTTITLPGGTFPRWEEHSVPISALSCMSFSCYDSQFSFSLILNFQCFYSIHTHQWIFRWTILFPECACGQSVWVASIHHFFLSLPSSFWRCGDDGLPKHTVINGIIAVLIKLQQSLE